MTVLTYLGHACFFFETERAACLVDPWLSPTGAFLGTWRQMPPNDHCLQWVLKKMEQKPVLVYVTHEHGDHYDEETLEKLLPYASEFCIPDYENTFFKNHIQKKLGVQPRLLAEGDSQRFHDIQFRIFIDESGINRDSAIFFKSKDLSFFDGNDCKIFDRASYLVETCGSIDILSGQFSGASLHPICYEMKPEEYKRVSLQKRMGKFTAMRNYICDLKAKYFLPSAGPPLFPYPENCHLNFEAGSIFPKWWEFEAYLKNKQIDAQIISLDVGGSVTAKQGELKFAGIARKIEDEELKKFVDYYRMVDSNLPVCSAPSIEEVLVYFEREMNGKIAVLKNNPEVRLACPVYCDIKTGEHSSVVYLIDPDKLVLEKVSRDAISPPYYLHETDVAAIGKLMRSGKGWGTYSLAPLYRNRRVPDIFDSAISIFFKANDNDDLDFGLKKLNQFRNNDEYIKITHNQGRLSLTCKRFCPHQGADLKYARFDGKYLLCPRHQWRFDCENGGITDNSHDSIDATITKIVAA